MLTWALIIFCFVFYNPPKISPHCNCHRKAPRMTKYVTNVSYEINWAQLSFLTKYSFWKSVMLLCKMSWKLKFRFCNPYWVLKPPFPPFPICMTLLIGFVLLPNPVINKQKVWSRPTWVRTSFKAQWEFPWFFISFLCHINFWSWYLLFGIILYSNFSGLKKAVKRYLTWYFFAVKHPAGKILAV